MLKLALPRTEGDSGGAPARRCPRTWTSPGLFQLLDPASFPAQLQTEGLGFSSALWSQVGAQAVIKMKVAGGVLEGRLYIVARGDSRRPLQELPRRRPARRRPRSSPTTWSRRSPASRGCSDRASRWRSPGTARTRSPSSTWTADARRWSPRWARTACSRRFHRPGAEIAFTSYLRNNPDLYIVSAAGGRARRVSKQPGLNTGRRLVAERAQPGAHPVVRRELRALQDRSRRRPDRGAPHQQPRHRQLARLLARRIADRLRVEPTGLAADLHHVGLGRRRQAGHLPGEVQPDAALEPARRQAADRLHGTRRAWRVRRLHPRREERQGRSRDARERARTSTRPGRRTGASWPTSRAAAASS